MAADDYDLPEYKGPTVRFVIEYAAPDEDEALFLARRLFAELDARIEAMTLVPVVNHVFRVVLDDAIVYERDGSGAPPLAVVLVRLALDVLGGKEADDADR